MRLAPLLALALLASGFAAGCVRDAPDCRSFEDTPRVIHQHAGALAPENVSRLLADLGWTPAPRRAEERDRAYASLDTAQPRLVLAYYDRRAHGQQGSAVEAYALDATSGSEDETRALLAPAAPALAALNASLGAPNEVKVEGLARMCASAWLPEGCEPDARATRRAPWEAEPTPAPTGGAGCQPVHAD